MAVSLEGWRIRKRRYDELFETRYQDFMSRNGWSYEQKCAYRDSQLQKMVKHCYETVPYYRNPDVIHTHLYACLYTFPWPLLRRKPFLHTFHLPPELENRRFLRRIISKFLIGMKVMRPVAISHQNQQFLSKYYSLSNTEIPVVYNPVELVKFYDLEPRINEDLHSSPQADSAPRRIRE